MTTVIESFVQETRRLNGTVVHERPLWNTVASQDAIRHYCFATSDDNPLWLDPEYAKQSVVEGIIAPPGFVCSVLYPFLHGAAIDAPLASLIGAISIEWQRPIRLNDLLSAKARQLGVDQSIDRNGRPIAFVTAETRYLNQHSETVAIAHGVLVRIERSDGDLLLNREPSGYSDDQRREMRRALAAEVRAGAASPTANAVNVGVPLPIFMRGPLSIGDLVCWQAGIGPSYRAGSLGYFDTLASPHTTVLNPVTGWPLKYSQQHEDFLMAAQRGMPAPFDNSLMRFAWLAPMLTDWMGDSGFLKKLSIETGAPILYGDTTWYRGIVTGKRKTADGCADLNIRITGVNQLGEITTTGSAVVSVPSMSRVSAVTRSRPRMTDQPKPPLAIARFQAVVRQAPLSSAIIFGDRILTFAELDALSDDMAVMLTEAGVQAGSIVALLFQRSPEAIAAILATLKIGAAFHSLDIDEPAERLQSALAQSEPVAVLASDNAAAKLNDLFSEKLSPRILVWCRSTEQRVKRPDAIDANREDLAYVMTTSGSQGLKRCIGVSQRSLALYLDALGEAFEFNTRDRYLHTAPLIFSASIRQTFGSLCFGATMVLASDAERRDPLLLMQTIKRSNATIWDTVPTAWQACLDTALLLPPKRREALLLESDLRLVLLTGEPLRWKLARQWREECPQARVFNLYSQTELAGTACAFEIKTIGEVSEDWVPLGFPLKHCEVELRGESPNQQRGEICIKGPRLASGYLQNPQLTSERFALRPFQHEGVFCTGDLGYIHADGVLRYAGRLDLIVKIRGQRVELSEIETALRSHSAVLVAAVDCQMRHDGELSLTAYVVPTDETKPPTTQELTVYLRGRLSDAALPARIAIVQSLPMTASGKLDRGALTAQNLPSFEAVAPDESSEDLDEVAKVIREIFCAALESSHVGSRDRFFDLGGNSLMATRVVASVRARFGVDLLMQIFFDDPTVAGLARAVTGELIKQIENLSDSEINDLTQDADSVEAD